jgi:hypothetical protein
MLIERVFVVSEWALIAAYLQARNERTKRSWRIHFFPARAYGAQLKMVVLASGLNRISLKPGSALRAKGDLPHTVSPISVLSTVLSQ